MTNDKFLKTDADERYRSSQKGYYVNGESTPLRKKLGLFEMEDWIDKIIINSHSPTIK